MNQAMLFNDNRTMPIIEENLKEGASIVLHSGDTGEFLKTIPSDTVQLIITSPPYNIGKEYETKTSIEKYLDTQEKVIQELMRVLKKDGSICWQVGNYVEKREVFPLDIFYYQIFKKFGLRLRNRIIWHFGHGLHASKRFSGRYETILWFSKTDEYIFNLDDVRVPSKYPGKRHFKGEKRGQISGNPLGKNPSDFWDFLTEEWKQSIFEIPNVKSNHPEKTIHPCQFPIELVERCILALTNENDWVLDPYSGVGSTLVASVKNNRKAMGCDKEEKYNTISRKRISDFFMGQIKTRPIGKPVHEPTGNERVAQRPREWDLFHRGATSKKALAV